MTSVTDQSPPAGPLTRQQIALLRQSFGQVESRGTIAALVFYKKLFTIDPSLQSMFQTSIELQARKLMESLSFTVATLESPEKLVPVLEAMGRRHVAYGVRDEHYETVVSALLQTLRETLGKRFTPDVDDAWTKALNYVASLMMSGANEVQSLKKGI